MAMQAFHTVAGRGNHPFDLVILAFHDGQFEGVRGNLPCCDGFQRFAFAMQEHACQQGLEQTGIKGMLECRVVDLGDLALGRILGVHELAVVGEQQQAGGVLIQAPDALHAALSQRLRQQGEDTAVVLRGTRTFETGRLMQGQIDLFAKLPLHAVDAEAQIIHTEIGARVVADDLVDHDGAAAD